MTTLLLALLCCGPVCQRTWQIDRPVIEIVQGIAANLPKGPSVHFPPEAVRLLEIIDLYAALEMWPAEHYYRVTVRMRHAPDVPIARRLRRVEKTLEVWARGNVTIVRSTLDVGWGPEGLLSNRIIERRLAPQVFAWEAQKIGELSK